MSEQRSLVIAALRGASQNPQVVAGTRQAFAELADDIAEGRVVVWPADDRVARAEQLLDLAASSPTSSGSTAAVAALAQATLFGAEQTKRLADVLDRVAWIPDAGSGALLVSSQS